MAEISAEQNMLYVLVHTFLKNYLRVFKTSFYLLSPFISPIQKINNTGPQKYVTNIQATKSLSRYSKDCLYIFSRILFRATCFHFASIESLFYQEQRITRAEQSVAIAKTQQTATEGASSPTVRRMHCTCRRCWTINGILMLSFATCLLRTNARQQRAQAKF